MTFLVERVSEELDNTCGVAVAGRASVWSHHQLHYCLLKCHSYRVHVAWPHAGVSGVSLHVRRISVCTVPQANRCSLLRRQLSAILAQDLWPGSARDLDQASRQSVPRILWSLHLSGTRKKKNGVAVHGGASVRSHHRRHFFS